jgi:hypothetical protein
MRFTADRPYSDPETAARKLLEIANAAEAVQDGRIREVQRAISVSGRRNASRTQGWPGPGDRPRLSGAS